MCAEDAVLGIHHGLAALCNGLAVCAVPCDYCARNRCNVDRHGDLRELTQVGITGELKSVVTLSLTCDSENEILRKRDL